LYPASLDLNGVPVLMVGAGAVAARKAEALLAAGADLTVVAERISPGLARLKGARLAQRRFRAADVRGQRLVFAATDDPALNARIAAAARERGAWVNVAAPPGAGNLQVPALVRRGPVCIAISTGGASCALARELRQRLESEIGPEWAAVARLLEQRRPKVLARIVDPGRRRLLLKKLGQAAWVETARREGTARAAYEMDRLIARAADEDAAARARSGKGDR
jgi:precorrin-2 dehydrogenase/sirohydrochlorin ferrochelatase